MADSQNKTDPSEQTGVADVRLVREKIAAQYHGDLREHIAQTNRIVQPLIEKLGLKEALRRIEMIGDQGPQGERPAGSRPS